MSDRVGDLAELGTPAARERTRLLIGQGRQDELIESALAEVGAGDAYRRERALAWFDDLADVDPLLDPLLAALRDAGHVQRRNAARSILGRLSAAGRTSALLARIAATDPDHDVRILAASALGESQSAQDAADSLLQATHDEDLNVASAAVEALGALGDPRALPRLIELARDGDVWIRSAAIVSLGRMQDPLAVPVLIDCLAESGVSELAGDAIERIGDASAVPALRPLAESGQTPVAQRALDAAVALAALGGAATVADWLRHAAARRLETLEPPDQRRDASRHLRIARLMGVAGTEQTASWLVEQAATTGDWADVVVGLQLLPKDLVADSVLGALDRVEPETAARLLGALPELTGRSHIAQLAERLGNPDPSLGNAVEAALLRADREVTLDAVRAHVNAPAAEQRLAACRVLARLDASHCDALLALLNETAAPIRTAAAEGLAVCEPATVRDAILSALDREADERVRLALIEALGAAGGTAALERLRVLQLSPSDSVRFAVAQALGRTHEPDALPNLIELLHDPAESVRHAALRSLGELGDVRASSAVAEHVVSPDRQLRRTAAGALERIPSERVRELLIASLGDGDWQVRLSAVRALALVGGPDARESLARVAETDADPLVRREARRAAGAPDSAD